MIDSTFRATQGRPESCRYWVSGCTSPVDDFTYISCGTILEWQNTAPSDVQARSVSIGLGPIINVNIGSLEEANSAARSKQLLYIGAPRS